MDQTSCQILFMHGFKVGAVLFSIIDNCMNDQCILYKFIHVLCKVKVCHNSYLNTNPTFS